MSGSSGGSERGHRFHIPFYDDVLEVAEVWFVLLLLLAVITLSFGEILNRNFDLGLWEAAIVNKVVYGLTFHTGVYGGVIAARRAKHISIDAVSHFTGERIRLSTGVLLQLVGAITCLMLAKAAYDFIYTVVSHTETILPLRDEWWLRKRLWRWPMVIGFCIMALHFFVNAIRFLVEALKFRSAPAEDA